MSYIFWASITLFIVTLIYYLVWLGLVWYWHEKKTSLLIIPLLYTFDFFIIAFLVMSLVVIVLTYTPDIIQLIQK